MTDIQLALVVVGLGLGLVALAVVPLLHWAAAALYAATHRGYRIERWEER